jgi:hypothetical protein
MSTAELERTREVLDAARQYGSFVAFTAISYDEGARATTTWLRKVPSLDELTLCSPPKR